MSQLYLLDTNIISELMRRPEGPAATLYRTRVSQLVDAQVATSIVVQCELLSGLRRVRAPRLQQHYELQMAQTPVLPLDASVALHYADLRCALEAVGKPMGPNDSLIAAHALALGAIMVSADAEFARVPGLTLENWLTP